MRIFQNAGLYTAYKTLFNKSHRKLHTFQSRINAFLCERYNASHLLLPVLERMDTAFFTYGDDKILQNLWAREFGMPKNSSMEEILLAQIENHRTEVFYNLDPMRFDSKFLEKLPSCVKVSICWRAAPSQNKDFSRYHKVVCNFPSIITKWESFGWSAGFFTPAHDPIMNSFAINSRRSLDVVFVGGFSRHHSNRNHILELVAQLKTEFNISFFFNHSNLNQIADSPLGLLPILNRFRKPNNVLNISQPPVFGLELYRKLSNAKIVLNAAIDMAKADRGNMRCFEALGCGALMISDRGNYPKGFVNEKTMVLYSNPVELIPQIRATLKDWDQRRRIAIEGHEMVKREYSKENQWKMFKNLI